MGLLRIPSAALLLAPLCAFVPLPAQQVSPGYAPGEGALPENILILVADDLGVDQVGVYQAGTDLPSTPVLDGLAAEGVRFDRAWSNPICSPTRATIQTGRYSFRTRIGDNIWPGTPALRPYEFILPEMLDAGTHGLYQHAAFGKWHLGNDLVGGRDAPNLAGYDHFAGTEEALGGYRIWRRVVNGDQNMIQGYATTVTVDDFRAWRDSVPEPWFAIVNFHAPHTPLHRPPAHLHQQDLTVVDSNRELYKAMVEALDSEIGRLLEELGPERAHTNVIFLGDNGTPRPVLAAGTPENQAKYFLHEGGIRVPLIVSGPRVTRPGSVSRALVNTTDLFSTVAELAGVRLRQVMPPRRELDSVSLVPYLEDPDRPSRREFAYAEIFRPNGPPPREYKAAAITDGRWKLIASVDFPRHEPVALYDLEQDPLEQQNLLEQRPLPQGARNAVEKLKRRIHELHQ